MQTSLEQNGSWLDKPVLNSKKINIELLAFSIIILLAILSRFYILDKRVMSHDENTHVYYSWRLNKGMGFAHDPLMHGPLQFHLIALTYFMFGDNDFTARTPAALFSIAAVAFMWAYRRYLGRIGALVAAILMLISPYMLFYGRYARNEAFVAFFGVVTIWSILRYFDTGKSKFLYILTTVTVLHFTAKETSFIYTAQALLFLFLHLIYRVSSQPWKKEALRRWFLLPLLLGLLLFSLAGLSMVTLENVISSNPAQLSPSPTAEVASGPSITKPTDFIIPALIVLGAVSFLVAGFAFLRGYSIEQLRKERSFDLLMLLGTLILPQLSAFPVKLMGWDIPTNASEVAAMQTIDIIHIAVFLVPLMVISILVGIWWNPREWLINAGIWYSIFIVFYTTIFTNGAGFFTGIVGSLGYWLEQQGVNRGSQPWYYYWLVQIPIYEYLPAIGWLLLMGMAFVKWITASRSQPVDQILTSEEGNPPTDTPVKQEEGPVVSLLLFWAVTSLIAYTFAGEKMPWLTVHITLPMILCAGWSFGKLIESVDWSIFLRARNWLVILLIPISFTSLVVTMGSLLGTDPPFQGKELAQLQATSTFLFSLIAFLVSSIGLYFLLKSWIPSQIVRVITLYIFLIMAFLTLRTAMQASYKNYDYANEILVYAHSAVGVKTALSQIEEISQRTTDGLAVAVAYDNETSYPYWWYLRNYPNSRYYGADPTRSLRDAPIILVGDANFGKIEPVVGQAYNRFDYIRLWWPNQDYFGLSWDRIKNAISNPQMREALFQIWLNRDYTKYGEVTGKDLSFPNWSPSARMRLYIRKDIISQLWNYGIAPSEEAVLADPYEGKQIILNADKVFGTIGTQPGQFQRPRGVAVAQDGSLYITDTENHRIQHISAEGDVLHTWGSFGDVAAGSGTPGTFNQPWGIEVAPDGSVYVADTWNHRIQRFSAEGEFIQMWGYFGQAESPEALWGPRDIAIDEVGNVYITDTGNKRVVIFDKDGNYIAQFGSAGMAPGQFDEPVGISLDVEGNIYIADTWNQRIQVIQETEDGTFIPKTSWEVAAWYGQSLDNKPYLDIGLDGHILATDPEGYRVLEFDDQGEIIRYWGDFGVSSDTFGMPVGIALDAQDGVWIVDTGNNRIMHFLLPKP